MSDNVKRLRDDADLIARNGCQCAECVKTLQLERDAADEIERLRKIHDADSAGASRNE